MRYKSIWFLSWLLVLGMASLVRADDPTSKFVSLAPIPSTLTPGSTGVAVQFEVWDQATAGTMIFSEAHSVDTDANSNITNDTGFADLLLGRPRGLNPTNFPAGSSRYLDVTVGGTSQLSARIPLYATPFSLNPGPQGPPGEQGPRGDQGPPGVVQTVTNADNSISVTGTPQDRTVAVANGGITNTHIGDGALSPAKTAGIAAILSGPNNFNGTQSISNGNLALSNTTPAGTGLLSLGGSRFLHNFGNSNTFLGQNAGNLTMSGPSNVAVGFNALKADATGGFNVAIGHSALSSNTDGCCNTASGFMALPMNTTGHDNTASGTLALPNNTAGYDNIAIGSNALYYNTTGYDNTAIGLDALSRNTTGSSNTAVGYTATVSAGDLTNATAIGSGAVVNASNKIRLGNTAVLLIEADGAFYAHRAGSGIILKSPNGAICKRLSINNQGVLVTTDVTPCP